MKPDSRVIEVDSTLQGERVAMTLDMTALPHLISVLTDLYSDPELAVIREYSTNALDSHVEAGTQRPIEVTLPTALSPFFRVRDYGVGLNAEDIREMYSKYGSSSKRDSDDVVGMLGLGSKSALTYTDQFTLTGYKNGIATVVSVSRDEDGGGSMTIVDEFETDESGVEVSVPVNHYNNFDSKAADFFRFWQPDTVLVNGEEPKRIGGLRVSDDIILTEELNESVLVMGNVAYEIPSEGYSYNRHNFVAYVEIGAVNFTPSRESLHMTRKTKDKIEEVKARVAAERNAAIAQQVEDAPSRYEALKLSLSAKRLGYNGDPLTYKGEEFPGDMIAPPNELGFLYVQGNKPYGRKGWENERSLAASAWSKVIYLVGNTGDSFSPTKRIKLEQWAEKNNVNINSDFLLIEKIPTTHRKWIDPKNIYKWADVAAEKVKIERAAARRDGRPTGSYEGYVNGEYKRVIQADEIDQSNPVFYVNKTAFSFGQNHVNVLSELGDHTVVLMASNRIKKFEREFPAAKPAINFINERIQKWLKNLSEGDKIAIGLQDDYEYRYLKGLDSERIDDPTLKDTVATLTGERLKKINKKRNLYAPVYRMHFASNLTSNPADAYPLLTALNGYATMNNERKEHLYLYINAAYAARKEQ